MVRNRQRCTGTFQSKPIRDAIIGAVFRVINLPIPGTRGEFHVKTAWVAGVPFIAVKVASGFYDNPALGLPTGSGMMAPFDAATGMPVGLLFDNGFLTDIRTGAAGAVAADCLARRDVETVGVIGSGVQARHQVACLREVRSFQRVAAWSIDRPGLERYCAEMRADYGVKAAACASAENVCRAADILVMATPSHERKDVEEEVVIHHHGSLQVRIGDAGSEDGSPDCRL